VASSAAEAAAGNATAAPQASIRLARWVPDAPYAKRLRAAPDSALYEIYLDERPSYLASTAFFLDVADLLFERGQPALANRVLSNLAEMNLENRHILRILGYRLLQAKQVALALPVLRKVLLLSPDEPQSYRDLGLALAQAGQAQPAIDHLWQVVERPWNNRFPDIELVALAELNAIVARTAAAGGPALDTRAIDPRLLRNLPLDLRVVLSWDADNTDIDLWVIDPNGERAFYGRRLTYQGGLMSNDFTGGYGPEEFSLRTAKPGTYTVRAQFYGHNQQIVAPATTLMLTFTTGFGTPGQRDEEVILRLAGRGQEVTVGTFTVGVPEPR
jgi:tetratricopeptide (TPR) repeat protein